MISGAGPAAVFAEVKSDFTDQEGLARRASRSSGGLVVEESVRIADALAVWIGCILLVRRVLRHCLCAMAQVSLRAARCNAL